MLKTHIDAVAEIVAEDDGGYRPVVRDSAGNIRVNAKGNHMTIEELVVEMKADTRFSRAFDSENRGGTGSNPGASKTVVKAVTGELSPREQIDAGLRARMKTG